MNESFSEDGILQTENISLISEVELSSKHPLNKQRMHQHNSKCFITEVFLHGITFILQRRVHNSSPNILNIKKIESFSSADDGYADDNTLSTQESMVSERSQIVSSGTSSEGFQETEFQRRTESHLDEVLNKLSSNLRSSICDSCITLPKFSKSFYKSLEHVLVYFQDKYHTCQWLNSNASQLTEAELNEARQELYNVYESMFLERINWGRIISMIGFVGELSVCALSADRFELIEEYVSTSVCFMNENIMAWIVEHGGWEGLVDFQTGQSGMSNDLDNIFSSLGRLAGVAALALAGVVICKFVADRI